MNNVYKFSNLCTLLIFSLALSASIGLADTLTVTNANSNGPGSLREAIEDLAMDGDVIEFIIPGAAPHTIAVTTSLIQIDNSITINGLGPENLVVDGNTIGSFEVLNTTDPVIISNLTIADGGAPAGMGGFGSAISNRGNLQLLNIEIKDNVEFPIWNDGTLLIKDSVVSENRGIETGGIFNTAAGILTIENSAISDNEGGAFLAGDGPGAIYNEGTALITDSTISGNEAFGDGGGILNLFASGIMTIERSTISNNSSNRSGGGIMNSGSGAMYINNSTISGNMITGPGLGGGIANQNATMEISNSTITDNMNPDSMGGGIASYQAFLTSTISIKNTLITDNNGDTDPNCFLAGTINDLGGNVTDSNGCTPLVTDDTFDSFTMLGPLQNNGGPTDTHDLLPNILNPAIDSVADCTFINDDPVTVDQRGEMRPFGPLCDVGAFEYVPELILNLIEPALSSQFNAISADNATAGGNIAFVWGFMPGNITVGGPTCNGLEIDIKKPRILSITSAFPNGFAEYIFWIPLIGDFDLAVLTQAVDIDTCRKSEVVENIIRKE